MQIARSRKAGVGGERRLAPAAAVALAFGVGACADLDRVITPPPVNPSSPIAPYAETVSRERFTTPSFQQVPPKPTDIRPAAAYKMAVVDELKFRRELAAWRAVHPMETSDAEAWADMQRSRIPNSVASPPPPTQDAESEAFAKRLREEAAKSSPKQ